MKSIIDLIVYSNVTGCDCDFNITDQLSTKTHKFIRHKLENELGRRLHNVAGGWYMVNGILYESIKTSEISDKI